jgi:uncharacterized membrane protein
MKTGTLAAPARTLLPGEAPLVASIARSARPATPDYLLRWSRLLTVPWTALFAFRACAPPGFTEYLKIVMRAYPRRGEHR